jgi:predicted ribosome quality control (RQC) complex YloA/Tae2 family protein
VSPEEPSAFVQEADCAERVIVLKTRHPGVTSFVIVAATTTAGAGAGLLAKESRQALWGARLPPGSQKQRPREESLAGARVRAIAGDEVVIEQEGDVRVIRPEKGRVVVTAPSDERAALAHESFVGASEALRAELEARGEALARALADDAIEIHRADVVKLLERAAAKVGRRRDAIRSDLDKIAQADRIAAQAQWLVAEAGRAKRGATKLVVTDWSTGEAVPMEVPLDPAKSAREQVEAMFKRAKRLKLGARIAEERLAQAESQQRALASALDGARTAESLAGIDEAARDAKRAAPRDIALQTAAPAGAKPKKMGAARQRTPFRTFLARSGRKLLVGKGAADNDALTLKVARPHDLWIHAKDRTGAHVIVPLDKGQTCPAEDLVDGAHLAAHFSDAREEKLLDVQYTDRRYLRKPKGSPPGFVIVDREKVIVLRVQREILSALLEREDATP